MAVAILATDSWIQHLPFEGGSRPSIYGPVDGVWYGLVSGAGDASGGNITLNGRLSFDRKEDWVYILGAVSGSVASTTAGGNAFTQVNTGPLLPTASVVANPSFSRGGISFSVSNNAIGTIDLAQGGPDPRAGMPIFGDKRIDGIFLMIAAGWETNINTAVYQLSSWGFLIRYNSFFRNVRPSVA